MSSFKRYEQERYNYKSWETVRNIRKSECKRYKRYKGYSGYNGYKGYKEYEGPGGSPRCKVQREVTKSGWRKTGDSKCFCKTDLCNGTSQSTVTTLFIFLTFGLLSYVL